MCTASHPSDVYILHLFHRQNRGTRSSARTKGGAAVATTRLFTQGAKQQLRGFFFPPPSSSPPTPPSSFLSSSLDPCFVRPGVSRRLQLPPRAQLKSAASVSPKGRKKLAQQENKKVQCHERLGPVAGLGWSSQICKERETRCPPRVGKISGKRNDHIQTQCQVPPLNANRVTPPKNPSPSTASLLHPASCAPLLRSHCVLKYKYGHLCQKNKRCY